MSNFKEDFAKARQSQNKASILKNFLVDSSLLQDVQFDQYNRPFIQTSTGKDYLSKKTGSFHDYSRRQK